MTDDLRWAVRYAFLEDLWRDRNRVIVDSGLEAALRAGAGPGASEEPLDELVDALVPRVSKSRTWMAVSDAAAARELSLTRPGTGFMPRGSFADVVAHRDWEVALVELSAVSDAAPNGARLREQLIVSAAEGRTIVVSARPSPGDDGDAGFSELSDLLEEWLGGGRIFGIYRPAMAAAVDFGAEDEGDDDADEVSLSFDNTLGSQSPRFVEYVGIAGRHPALPEGMTLLELPEPSVTIAGRAAEDEALRTQLLQAQRQAEMAVIDRQALLEKVDLLESERGRLQRQHDELRDELARAVTDPAPAEAAEQLQAALADNQALRWKVQQLDRELGALRARPVEALEAEVATLRAQLAQRAGVEAAGSGLAAPGTDATRSPGTDAMPSSGAVEVSAWSDESRLEGLELEAMDTAERLRFGAVGVDLDRIIAQVERGGIGVLPLRQALVALRKRLKS